MARTKKRVMHHRRAKRVGTRRRHKRSEKREA